MRFKISNLNSTKDILEKSSGQNQRIGKILALTKSTLESTADGILVVDLKGNINSAISNFSRCGEFLQGLLTVIMTQKQFNMY